MIVITRRYGQLDPIRPPCVLQNLSLRSYISGHSRSPGFLFLLRKRSREATPTNAYPQVSFRKELKISWVFSYQDRDLYEYHCYTKLHA
jgi:hypothetical protein